METDYDIVITGGGLNGPALGLALAQAGFSVAIVDARPANLRAERGFDGRAYALALASQRLLKAIHIWPQIAGTAQPIAAVKASDGRAGEGASAFFLHFEQGELEEGPLGFMVEDRHLYAAFMAALPAAGVTLLSGQSVESAALVGAQMLVTLSSGRSLRAKLLVGCDGRGSATAERAGIRRLHRDYGQTALVTAVEHEKPHNGIAQQFFMPEGPLAILPLQGNRSSIVWSETRARAEAIQALPDAEYLLALRPRFGDFLGNIALAGARFTYPLSLSLAEHYYAARVALVGDAAHGVHPVAGQGLNLGLRDVAALAEVVTLAARRGEDIGALDVLARYEQWRRFDATLLAFGMDGVNSLFSNDNPLLRLGRDLGMGVISALPSLRRRFMREAAGLDGDLPQLLRGLPL